MAIPGKFLAAQPCWWLAGGPFGRLACSRRFSYRLVIYYLFGKDCRYPNEPAAESTPGNQAAVMCAETKFSKMNQLTPIKEPAGGMKAERRVDRIDGGFPMESQCINFRVAGLVKQGGFV